MKISNETVAMLKNFSTINPNIVVKAGNVIKTISEAKNILATANVAESFPQDFGIYDLNELLSVVGMFEDPDLEFGDDGKTVKISEGGQSVNYFFSDASILTTPQKDITMPACEIELDITEDQMSNIRRAAAALGASDVVVVGEEGGSGVTVKVTDTKDSTANSYEMSIPSATRPDSSFEMIFNISNFKFVGGDMKVSISSKLISQFATGEVTYWVALEKNSKFNA